MKTITFYSYKGGTGRSLAAANMAMALYRIGVSVCLLDFDLHAPGLHHKLSGQLGVRTDFDVGIADYILGSLLREKRLEKKDLEREFGVTDALPTTLAEIVQTKPGGNGTGKPALHFIPAGRFDSDRYWRIAMHPTFDARVGLQSPADQAFFEQLKEDVAKLTPPPEYFIVDSRSGVNELSGISTRLLANANTVVIFTVNHPEGILGSKVIMGSLSSAYKKQQKNRAEDSQNRGPYAPEGVCFVLSRIPEDKSQAADLYWKATEAVYEEAITVFPLRVKWLPHDDTLSLDERLFIPADGKLEERALTQQYLDLFANLVDDADNPEHSDKLRLLSPKAPVLRRFDLVEETGQLINPEDGVWNVAFRKDTFVRTLETIYNSIRQNSPKDEAETAAEEAMFKAGQGAAGGPKGFGSYAASLRRVGTKGLNLTVSEAIRKWCEFDSNVGFGRFGATVFEGGTGQIVITGNFLTDDRDKNQLNLCSFMSGYISTILKAIYETDMVEVTHDRGKDCSQYTTSDPPVCRFGFTAEI